MRSLFQVLSLISVALIAACAPAAPPSPAAATNPPPPPTVPSALSAASPSPAAKPAAPAPSPAIAASPSAGAVASPSAGPAVNTAVLASGVATPGFVLQSSAFTAGGNLPSQFSCDAPGGGQSPPLSWSGAPATARAFALVDQDPDAGAGGAAFTHWVVFNIPSSVTQIDAGMPAQDTLPNGALQGQNGRRVTGYQGACPPAGSPAHHYTFQLFALDGPLPLQPGASIVDLQRAMTGHIVGQTQLVALFGH
jgi:Raf kinase inhibitor-like YbhB/YbcL family protein